MIHLIYGSQGSGKSLLLCKQALHYSMCQRTVYSNLKFKFDFRPLDYMDILKCTLNNSCICWDEIHQVLSSRKSHSRISIEIVDNFISMVRKQYLNIFATTQTPRKVDVRFREEATFWHKCEKYAIIEGKTCKVMDFEKYDKSVPIIVLVKSFNMETEESREWAFHGNPFFQYYDSFQIVQIKNREALEDYVKTKTKAK